MRSIVVLACAVIGLGSSSSARAQSDLPARLDDRSFWNLVIELSEPGGSFADENYVSNELGLQRLLPELRDAFAPADIYLGVGPEQNFSYLSALRPRLAFIVDIRRQNMLEHLLYKALFEMSDDRADFLSRLFSRPRPAGVARDSDIDTLLRAYRVVPADRSLFAATLSAIGSNLIREHGFALESDDEAAMAEVLDAFYQAGPDIAYVYHESEDWHPNYIQLMDMADASGVNWSFLGSADNFTLVRRMQLDNLIVPVVGDFAGPKTLRAIGAYARRHGASIDVFYVSNVEPYLFADDVWRAFYENVMTLPITEDSVFVRTFFGSTARACPDREVVVRSPVASSIPDSLQAYRHGDIASACSLVDLSR